MSRLQASTDTRLFPLALKLMEASRRRRLHRACRKRCVVRGGGQGSETEARAAVAVGVWGGGIGMVRGEGSQEMLSEQHGHGLLPGMTANPCG